MIDDLNPSKKPPKVPQPNPEDPDRHESLPPDQDPGSACPWEAPYIIGLLVLMLLALICWPYTSALIRRVSHPPQAEYLGSVQSISFIGGLGSDTQVWTETRTFLLRGALHLKTGTPLQRRPGAIDDQVCVVDTELCHHLLSH